MRMLFIVAFILVCIFGYGYWHAITHASFHIALNVKDGNNGEMETLPGAKLVFLDAAGKPLANGIIDQQYNFVHIIHPEAGDCHEVERSALNSKLARKS